MKKFIVVILLLPATIQAERWEAIPPLGTHTCGMFRNNQKVIKKFLKGVEDKGIFNDFHDKCHYTGKWRCNKERGTMRYDRIEIKCTK